MTLLKRLSLSRVLKGGRSWVLLTLALWSTRRCHSRRGCVCRCHSRRRCVCWCHCRCGGIRRCHSRRGCVCWCHSRRGGICRCHSRRRCRFKRIQPIVVISVIHGVG